MDIFSLPDDMSSFVCICESFLSVVPMHRLEEMCNVRLYQTFDLSGVPVAVFGPAQST